jgi:hypothetical protein
VADEPEDKPDGDAPARETEVGHKVVEGSGSGSGSASGDEGTTEVFFSRPGADEPSGSEDADLNPQPLPPVQSSDAPSQPQPAAAPSTPSGGTSPAAADRAAAESHDQFEQKPEIFIGAAFVGAFVFGKLLKKLTRDD